MARDNDITNDTDADRMDGTRDDRTVRTDPARDTTRTDSTVTDGTRTDGARTQGTRDGYVAGNPREEIDLRSRERRTEVGRDHVHRQREFYGGFKWGAAFFGWLSANGLTVLLVAIASAAGVAFGLTQSSTDEGAANAETVGLAGAIVLLVIIGLGYYAGGYVAGRMARFDGARQGVGVWLIGLLVTVALAVAGVVFGSEYNVLNQLDLPRIPVDEGDATTAGIIALVAVLLVTLLAAISGGKVGERYHRKVDRAGIDA